MRNKTTSHHWRNLAAAAVSLAGLGFCPGALADTNQQLTQDAPPVVVCGATTAPATTATPTTPAAPATTAAPTTTATTAAPTNPTAGTTPSTLAGPQLDTRYATMKLLGYMPAIDNSKPVTPNSLQPGVQLPGGVQGALPEAEMWNKSTPAISLVQYFPWLWKDIDLVDGNSNNVQAQVYRGTGLNAFYDAVTPVSATQILNADAADTTDTGSVATPDSTGLVDTTDLNKTKCMPISDYCSSAAQPFTKIERWTRLQYDSCTNQFILPLSLQPLLVFSPDLRQNQAPWNESICQPLRMSHVDCLRDPQGNCKTDKGSSDGLMYDYRAWGYLELAWQNLLSSDYMINPKGGGVSDLTNPLQFKGTPPVTNPTTGARIGAPGTALMTGTTSTPVHLTGGTNFGQPFAATTPGYDSSLSDTADGLRYSSSQATYTGSLTTINDLAQPGDYERIRDPSHPYTPRWDYSDNERHVYSPMTWLKDPSTTTITENTQYSSAGVAAGQTLGYDQIGTPYTAAGAATPPGGLDSAPYCVVRCAAVPVDILSFRSTEFDACMKCRIKVNEDCFWSQVWWLQQDESFCMGSGLLGCALTEKYTGESQSAAWNNTVNDTLPPDDACSPIPLPDCIHFIYWMNGQFNEAKYDTCKTTHNTNNQWPICSTKFDYPRDLGGTIYLKSTTTLPGVPASVGSVSFPLIGGWPQETCDACTAMSGDPNPANGVKKCCSDLAQALVPVNTLKIRNTSPQYAQIDPTHYYNIGAIPEGYAFTSYFGNPNAVTTPIAHPAGEAHMPYMRWWDTGTAAGGTQDSTMNYDPHCDLGSWDTIIGVGTEAKETKTGTGGKFCRYGGNGQDFNGATQVPASYDCIKFGTTDSLTSWTELKLYQSYAIRKYGLNCLPQYEKFDKQFGAEDGALFAAGGYISSPHAVNPSDLTQTTSQTIPWPLAWRGYLTDLDNGTLSNTSTDTDCTKGGARFPCLNQDASNHGYLLMGLDNAIEGDIIYLNHDDVASPANSTLVAQNINAMPFIAVVTSVWHKGDALGHCTDSVTAVDINNGKFPDVCGTTNFAGLGQQRKIYKEWLPANTLEALYPFGTTWTNSCGNSYTVKGTGSTGLNVNSNGNCADPRLAVCTFSSPQQSGANVSNGAGTTNLWDKIHIYRHALDERK